MPDVRLFDETAELHGANYGGSDGLEGCSTCKTDINTQEVPTYALFSGNDDAICNAWTGVASGGRQQRYGFHAGNGAHACDRIGDRGGCWYVLMTTTNSKASERRRKLTIRRFYSGQKVPGISSEDDVFCAWIDRKGDIPTTGFSVHWPELDCDNSPDRSLNYYCNNNPSVEFRNHPGPNTIAYWLQKCNSKANTSSPGNVSEAFPLESGLRSEKIMRRFEKDPMVVNSYFPKHAATELCNRSLKPAGQSFVSFAERKFCFMPTKTWYDFCEDVEEDTCWDEKVNGVVAKNVDVSKMVIPDLSHISKVVVWGA